MERTQQPNDPRGTPPRESRAKTWSTKGCGRGLVFACASLYFVLSLFGAVNWSLWRHTATNEAVLSSADFQETKKLLGVVVPTHGGDLQEAVAALSTWPSTCSTVTLHRMQLVLYYSGTVDDGLWSEEILDTVAQTGGRCFERTRVVFADLDEQDNHYPKGPSVMFYKMFLDREVARSFGGYDALAILEWDVIVAHPTSFERLYRSAFLSSEEFWMKGSTLTGAEFHETAGVSDMWHILGHLNGNAIYNNTDPAFNEFVNYTLSRWKYTYPYDVALWATIADFPYSWPLWQRYSSKFVATQLMANVGFYDVTKTAVGRAISRDTLFIHGSSVGGGSTTNNAFLHVDGDGPTLASDCTSECGSADTHETTGVSTFCDTSCSPEWSPAGPRLNGHGCGASDPSRFGTTCRQCYTNQEAALAEERKLSSSNAMGSDPGVHVVMCSTGNPPPASECSDECMSAADTVCDFRCGSNVYGDLHCNWRGLGQTCRFCFQDEFGAHLADEMAKLNGSRVVLCATHEPPVQVWSNLTQVLARKEAPARPPAHPITQTPDTDIPWDAFTSNITRGDMCAFIPGYFEFLPETRISVASVLHFMPGMRVGIATNPSDFHVFNRTLGQVPKVNIVNSSRVEHSSLDADKACGAGTLLIWYLDVGVILSRSFTEKDTHTPRGDLVVAFTHAESSRATCDRRAMATDILLGFSPPCFTYGGDLILPADINEQLRRVLRANPVVQQARAQHKLRRRLDQVAQDSDADYDLAICLASINQVHREYAAVHVPQVLAALAFSRNHPSVEFVDSRQWSVENMFATTSIWDIPLVKPLFGCHFNGMLSRLGYNLSERVAKEFESFKLGNKCELGYKGIHPTELKIKTDEEFGVIGALQDMPDLGKFRVSVMYRTFSGDAKLFDMSLQTVMAHFPSAHEVVAVVIEEDGALFEEILERHRGSAPFPLRLVTEPDLMDGNIQQKYSKLRADLYTEGDHVLHLDSDVVLLEDLNYSHIFHLGKPVLPFRRYRTETFEGRHAAMCWQQGTSFAIGEDLLHEFSIFNTHVYPRAMYPAARQFIEEHHKKPFVDFMSSRCGFCLNPDEMEKLPQEKRNEMFSDFNFIGAYLWYHMHDAVYWLPSDPWDTEPDQWRPDLSKYAWVCQAEGRHAPEDEAGMIQFVADFHMVQNQRQCRMVIDHWIIQKHKHPATRQKIDTGSAQWLGT